MGGRSVCEVFVLLLGALPVSFFRYYLLRVRACVRNPGGAVRDDRKVQRTKGGSFGFVRAMHSIIYLYGMCICIRGIWGFGTLCS